MKAQNCTHMEKNPHHEKLVHVLGLAFPDPIHRKTVQNTAIEQKFVVSTWTAFANTLPNWR